MRYKRGLRPLGRRAWGFGSRSRDLGLLGFRVFRA